jgi:hypothetical protein
VDKGCVTKTSTGTCPPYMVFPCVGELAPVFGLWLLSSLSLASTGLRATLMFLQRKEEKGHK